MPKSNCSIRGLSLLATALFALTASAKDPAIPSYVIGVDGLATLTSGPFAGLPNPNHGRLTFLMAHTYPEAPEKNHYHSIGRHEYHGENLGAATTTRVSLSNYVPERTVPPLRLLPAASGPLQGRLVNQPAYDPEDDEYDYAFVTFIGVDQLAGHPPGSPQTKLLNSSSGRWQGSVAAASIVLELVDITPGLEITDASGRPLFTGLGGRHVLGSSFTFTPVFSTATDAAPGTYVARFRLHDANDRFASSGEFELRFRITP
jgi:hypothetical protein